MNSYSKSIFVMGVCVPVMLAAIIFIGCMVSFTHYNRKLARQSRLFTAINAAKQQLEGAEEEARFLDAEIGAFSNTKQLDVMLSSLQSSLGTEKGAKWIGSSSLSSNRRTFSIEGLSGPTVPLIGEAFKKAPTVMIESWNIQKNRDGKRLVFSVNTTLSITERGE